jgi:hypothetical protein
MTPELQEAIDILRWGALRSDGLSCELKPKHCNALYDLMEQMAKPPRLDVGTEITFEGRLYRAVSFESVTPFGSIEQPRLEEAAALTVIVERCE